MSKLATNNAAARRVWSTRPSSSNEHFFLSIDGQEATHKFPPKVQAWMNRKGPVELSTKVGAAKENLLNDREQGEHEERLPYDRVWIMVVLEPLLLTAHF